MVSFLVSLLEFNQSSTKVGWLFLEVLMDVKSLVHSSFVLCCMYHLIDLLLQFSIDFTLHTVVQKYVIINFIYGCCILSACLCPYLVQLYIIYLTSILPVVWLNGWSTPQ